MVEIGSLFSPLADRPMPITTVKSREEHDATVVAVPTQTEEEREQPVTERFITKFQSMLIFIMIDP